MTCALLLLDPVQQTDKIRHTPPCFSKLNQRPSLPPLDPLFNVGHACVPFSAYPVVRHRGNRVQAERTREGSILPAPECISQMRSPQWEYWQDRADRTWRRTARCMHYTARSNAPVMDGVSVRIGQFQQMFQSCIVRRDISHVSVFRRASAKMPN